MLKSKNQRIKELLAENKLLKEENTTLKEQVCKCKVPKKEKETDNVVAPSPAKTKGNIISKSDFFNL